MKRRLYKLIIRLFVLLLILSYVLFIRKFFRVVVPSESMFPTIKIGDQVLVLKCSPDKLERGDIVVFSRESELYIKRLIGLPGDYIVIENGIVYVNGCMLSEDYVKNNNEFSGQFIVPKDSYFVLGDNRNNSRDSRYWSYPYINSKQLIGKAVLFIYPDIYFIKEMFYEVY